MDISHANAGVYECRTMTSVGAKDIDIGSPPDFSMGHILRESADNCDSLVYGNVAPITSDSHSENIPPPRRQPTQCTTAPHAAPVRKRKPEREAAEDADDDDDAKAGSKKARNKKSHGRSRTSFSAPQVEALEKVFEMTQYPDIAVIEGLSDKMQLPRYKIEVWFQNRRAKFKRQNKDDRKMLMRNQIFPGGADPTGPTSGVLSSCHVLTAPPSSQSAPPENENRRAPTTNYPDMEETLTDISSSAPLDENRHV
ncbi:PREDICTED: homeobox expressed in ES cells 1-A-like [Priapulus caudatus]|uniref:Homeobox expressed in ES cells 1-A-like n=1 Tax=Priapulus caudatus TaxID=37621 RepID=A0ABM1ENT2_PRICU|nr:PREDICTED: homeobox expressed in ES cells 1-A-like [Priapulus caudatus]